MRPDQRLRVESCGREARSRSERIANATHGVRLVRAVQSGTRKKRGATQPTAARRLNEAPRQWPLQSRPFWANIRQFGHVGRRALASKLARPTEPPLVRRNGEA